MLIGCEADDDGGVLATPGSDGAVVDCGVDDADVDDEGVVDEGVADGAGEGRGGCAGGAVCADVRPAANRKAAMSSNAPRNAGAASADRSRLNILRACDCSSGGNGGSPRGLRRRTAGWM
jgi:hypothetical protein